jgi:hypothetical protein
LLLEESVEALGLLLLSKLKEILALAHPSPAVLSGRRTSLLNGALRAFTTGSLEKELGLLPAA